MYYVQVTGDGGSRWSRYLSDNYTDAADVECDDSDYLSKTDRRHEPTAAKLKRLSLLLSHIFATAFSFCLTSLCSVTPG